MRRLALALVVLGCRGSAKPTAADAGPADLGTVIAPAPLPDDPGVMVSPDAPRPEPSPPPGSPVRATVGMPAVQGRLDPVVIRSLVVASFEPIRECFEHRLATQSFLAGTVMTMFQISKSGTVSAASAAGLDAEVDACIATAIRALRFSKPADGASVRVAVSFTFDVAP